MSSSTYKSYSKHKFASEPRHRSQNVAAGAGEPDRRGEPRGASRGGASGGGGGGGGGGRCGSAGRRAAAPWEVGGCHGGSDSAGVLEGDDVVGQEGIGFGWFGAWCSSRHSSNGSDPET
jgi:hypothetical protein